MKHGHRLDFAYAVQLHYSSRTHRAAYINVRHAVTVEMANEAYGDPDAVVFDPDPASRSGSSVRTIGYSTTAAAVLVVITVLEGGTIFGANAWRANPSAVRRYKERNQ